MSAESVSFDDLTKVRFHTLAKIKAFSVLKLQAAKPCRAAGRHARKSRQSEATSDLIFGEVMRITNSGEVVLDGTDSERLSKLIEWAAQFVNSIDHITVQEAAQFVRDWKARTAVAPLLAASSS